MKTLIVDDQYDGKVRAVATVLRSIGVDDVEQVGNAKDAIHRLRLNKYDMLILDLQIPAQLGDEIEEMGGRTLLEFIELDKKIIKPTSVIGITSHADSYASCEEFFRDRGWQLILGADDTEKLTAIFNTQKAHIASEHRNVDVVIVTALARTELQAVLNLPMDWERLTISGDGARYWRGYFNNAQGRNCSVIALNCPSMGMPAASAATAAACQKFHPKLVVMTGIAAGIVGKVELGDILVASPSWDWGSGKLTLKNGHVTFLGSPNQIPLDPGYRAILEEISVERTYMDEIYAGWKGGNRPSHNLNVHVGPVGSGAVVLEDPSTVEMIQGQHRNTIGIEMEAYGVMSSVFYTAVPGTKVIVMKSVCDFADPHKNNDWQAYAAYTSSSLAYRFLLNHAFES
jgi:nucleoside phosphorylase